MYFDWIMDNLFHWVWFIYMNWNLDFVWYNFLNWVWFGYVNNVFNFDVFHVWYGNLHWNFVSDWTINVNMDRVVDLLFDSVWFWHVHRYFYDFFDGIMDSFDNWVWFWYVNFDGIWDMFHMFNMLDIDNWVRYWDFLNNCQSFLFFNWSMMPAMMTFFAAMVVAVGVNSTLVLFFFGLRFICFCFSWRFFNF